MVWETTIDQDGSIEATVEDEAMGDSTDVDSEESHHHEIETDKEDE